MQFTIENKLAQKNLIKKTEILSEIFVYKNILTVTQL